MSTPFCLRTIRRLRTTAVAALCLAMPGAAGAQTCYIEESAGLVVFEAEHLPLTDGWVVESVTPGASGSDYITWAGADYFTSPGFGTVSVGLIIRNAGTYRFSFRSRTGEGSSFTDFNDTWLSFPDADAFYGERSDGHVVYPRGSGLSPVAEGAGADGWFKVYLTGTTEWTWSTNTSDNDPHDIYVTFDAAGDYTMMMSARSRRHLIDRIVLSNGANDPFDLSIPSASCGEAASHITPESVTLTGEQMRWHKQTLSFAGPDTHELATPNPFMDFRVSVVFSHAATGRSSTVQGYYAACDTAADSSCDAGNVWRAHFTPDELGQWNWVASFESGTDIAVGADSGTPAGYFDGLSGSFFVTESDKPAPDHRAASRGRLAYVGEHYLRYSGTGAGTPNGKWFLKAGPDAPENTLAYNGFDGTPDVGARRKTWSPHASDYDSSNADAYNWGDGRGSNILGMISYLSGQQMNVFSFLTFNVSGDDGNAFPHLLAVDPETYADLSVADQWEKGVHHDRFDVSKLDQWERLFAYADAKGMYLHFKMAEEENETKMDGGDTDRERRAYYREIVARFGHHLALNWNVGEENGPPVNPMTDAQRVAAADYLRDMDPYDHLIVLHTRPDRQADVYRSLLGDASAYNGASVQSLVNTVHDDVGQWIRESAASGKKWVVANDEQGPHQFGVGVDFAYTGSLPSQNLRGDNRADVRRRVLWGTLLAGGAGVEYYYGYETGCADLDCQDQRTRESKWSDARVALRFFDRFIPDYLPDVVSADDRTASVEDYVLVAEGKAYVVYLPAGGTIDITLPEGDWKVQWYNPREGGELSDPMPVGRSITAPDALDWVALIRPWATGVSDDPNLGAAMPSSSSEAGFPDSFGPATSVTFSRADHATGARISNNAGSNR